LPPPINPNPQSDSASGPLSALGEALARLGKLAQDVLVPTQAINPVLKALGDALSNLGSTASSALSVFAPLGDMLSKAVSASLAPLVVEVGAAFTAMVAEATAPLALMVAEMGAAFAAMVAEETGALAIIDAVVGGAMGVLLAEVIPTIGVVVAAVTAAAAVIYAELAPVMPIILAVGAALAAVAVVALAGAVAITAVVGAIAAVASAAAGVVPALIGMGMAMSQFVGKANPAIVEIFTAAVDDLLAVIGQSLTPVFRVVTQMVRMAADSFTTWMPQLGALAGVIAQTLVPAFQVFTTIMNHAGQGLVSVVQAILPALEMVAGAFTALMEACLPLVDIAISFAVPALKVLGNFIGLVASAVAGFSRVLANLFTFAERATRAILRMIGIDLPGFTEPRGGESVGYAAKSTQIGSVQNYLQDAQKAAFSIGTGATDPATRTVGVLETISGKFDELIRNLPGMLRDAFMRQLPGGETVVKVEGWLNKDGVAGTGASTGSDAVDWVLNHTPQAAAIRGAVGAAGWVGEQLGL